ncbi:hypothetical protein DWU98_00720 [Dyella monticola]|uniref:Tetratricopeptide repeat protein n=1 Tax=Dyella monticola TaxID=1927958 RepID=A0A370X8D8_9GAMM|nr:hypothetical protein [Dyella monticola]RDS84531.1 hypothetical protein DWU98_00720 [Dyella monticola]
MTDSKTPVLRTTLLALTLCVLTALMFWPAVSGGFIFDDYPVFAENPAVHISHWHWEKWQALWIWSQANIQRPLAMSSYALNYALGGSEFSFKVTNLCIHLFNAFLVFLLARHLLRRCWNMQTSLPKRLDYWSLGIATAWAVHPLQVSAVMYVVQRMELLGFTFTLLALLAYSRARQRQMRREHAWPWLLLCITAVIIGYNCKETVILVPAYALLLELTVFRFEAQQAAIHRAWKLGYTVGTALGFVVVVAYLLPHYASPVYYVGRHFDATQREFTQLRVLCMYLAWAVLPLPRELHFYYDNYPASTGLFDPLSTLWSGLFLIGLAGLAITLHRRRPLFALGIGWFFLAHALTSSTLSLELVFEHRNYPALFGVSLAIADLFWIASQRLRSNVPAAVAIMFMLNLCFLTLLRAATWGSPFQLALSLVQSNPGSARAAEDLARRYVAMSNDNPTNPLYAMGIRELERATQLNSATALPEEALLSQIALHPGPSPTPWWISLQHKLQIQPINAENYRVLYNLMELRLSPNPSLDAYQLAKAYKIAIARDPSRISLHAQYAELAARALNAPAVAIEQWRQVVLLEKATPDYVEQLTAYLANNHRIQEAAAVLDEAENIQPSLRGTPAITMLQAKVNAGLESAGQRRPSS